MLQIGSLVDNKYKILNEIGRGGMSVVYLAINERANKTWAIKEVRKDGVCDFEAVKQGLIAETDMLKKLHHPHMPSIVDVIDTDDSFIIVMDFIEGTSLQKVLKTSGAQPKDLVIKWGEQLCDVLGYLHSRTPAIIYRDMKPSNVMLKPDGNITLIDFGTAREFKNRAMVEDTTCLGTRGYAAPEQFGGRGQTDARTDIYCLGATMYHLLTGHNPAEPPYEIKSLGYWDPAYEGSGMEMIISKCCQQDPDARYQNCAELLYDLQHEQEWGAAEQIIRRKKWNAFLASVALTLVGVVGMIGFGLAKESQVKVTYDYYLQQTESLTSKEDFNDFVSLVKDAIEVDPGRYEAYDVLISRIEEDNVLDYQTEFKPIYECLEDTVKGNNRNNETNLQNSNLEGYADIQFRVGKLLFLMSTGEEENLRRSASYFKKALEYGGMADAEDEETQKKARLASSLKMIGEYIGSLNQSLYTENENTYSDLYEDLKKLVEENPIDSMGSKAYGIALYNRIGSMMVSYYEEFANEDIAVQDMYTLLDQMDLALTETQKDLTKSEVKKGVDQLIQNALQNNSSARKMIDGLKGGDS